ncbi:DUF4278 domain-containing protein [Cyanobacteria bacterium FACHB-472]|nr:DUF4278 domain-containing protein [Cyanobacteria bacterium FACHB-472]
MKLQYRGNSYDHNPQSIETIQSEITAKFRGVTYKINHRVPALVRDSIVNLKFRGVAYIKGKNSEALLLRKSWGSSMNDTQSAC